MCKHTITVLAASLVLALASFLPGPAQAQNDPARPAAQDLASEPIGKVVAATGSVTIEHASAVVVQANVPGQVGQTKVGDPNLKAVWSGRCWTRAILGALQAALEDCNRALQGATNAATYDSRGLIYLKMGQLDAAIEDYNAALRFEPKLASALYGRGLAKLRKGDKTGSDTDLSTAQTIQANIGDDFVRYGVQ